MTGSPRRLVHKMTYPLVFRGDGVVGPGSTYVQCHEGERASSYSPTREGCARRMDSLLVSYRPLAAWPNLAYHTTTVELRAARVRGGRPMMYDDSRLGAAAREEEDSPGPPHVAVFIPEREASSEGSMGRLRATI